MSEEKPLKSEDELIAKKVGRLWSHPFTKYLDSHGFQLRNYYWHPGMKMPSALSFCTQQAHIMYRFEGFEKINILLYRRLNPRIGLISGFRDFIWLLHVIARPESQLRYIEGTVKPLPNTPEGELPIEKSAAFYKRVLNAIQIDTTSEGYEIIRGDTKTCFKKIKYRPPEAIPLIS